MTLRDQIRRKRYREDDRVTGVPAYQRKEHQDLTSDEIREMRAARQREREQEQHAGPDDTREMFKLAEEAGRLMAPVDTDLSPGNPEAVGLMADNEGMMMVDQLATGDSTEGDMADLMVAGDTGGGLMDFISGGDG